MAAFFAINIQEFPRPDEGSGSLALSYVSKYTCTYHSTLLILEEWLMSSTVGIGLAISVPLIIGALTIDNIARFYNRFTVARARKRTQIRDARLDSRNTLSSLHTQSKAPLGHYAQGFRPLERTSSVLSKILKVNSWARQASELPRSNTPVPPAEHHPRAEYQMFPDKPTVDVTIPNGERRRHSRVTFTSQISHDLEKGR